MKLELIAISFLILITSCTNVKEKDSCCEDTSFKSESELPDSLAADEALYYLVIADTSQQFEPLMVAMENLQSKTDKEIEMFNRYYDTVKKELILPEDDEDEIFAGGYFLKRNLTNNLSIEYLSAYTNNAGEKTFALVTGIYENEEEAKADLAAMQKFHKKAFIQKAIIYLGCLH